MKNLLATIVILLIVGGAFFYIVRAKKSGQKCIGCPHSKECGKSKCECNNKTDINDK